MSLVSLVSPMVSRQPQYQRRRVAVCSLLCVLAGLLGVASSSPVAHASAPVPTSNTISFALTGSIVGGVKRAGVGAPIAFSFRLKNSGTTSQDTTLELTKVTGYKNPAFFPTCVDPVGEDDSPSPDGNNCEYGTVKPGQTVGLFGYLTDAGTTMSVVVRACANIFGATTLGPCLTLSVPNV